MKKFWLGIIVWTFAAWNAHADDYSAPPIYSIGGTMAPYIDKDGYVNPIVALGNIDFGKGLLLPLVLNFSSAIRTPSPEFGQGWECPFFDSKIFDVQQNLKKMETLGGREIFLIYNPRTDKWKHYFSDHWTGVANGDDFVLTYDHDYTFSYHKGLISSMTMPDGKVLLWNRNGDKLVSMGISGQPPAIKVVYDKLGFAKQILLNPDNLGTAKKTYDFDSSLVYAGIDKIQCPDGRAIAFDRSRDKDLNPILKWTDSKGLAETLSWSLKTGKIISDDSHTYEIAEVEPTNTWPKMVRKNKITNKIESYYFDEKHGTTDETLADGTMRHTEMSQAPGPNFKQVRLIEETKNGKTQIILRRAFDDQGHLLLEAIGLANGKEDVKQYVYDSAARVVSYLHNGKEMWKNVYDPVTGQLKMRELTALGVKLAFDQLPGGDVKESIEKASGAVTSTKTLDVKDWQSTLTSMQRIQ